MATSKKTAAQPRTRTKTDRKKRLTTEEKSAVISRLIKKEEIENKTKAEVKAETIAGRPKLPNVLRISQKTVLLLWQHRWLFLGIAAVYGVLNVILVRGLSSSSDIASLKQLISGQYQGGSSRLISSLAIFGLLVASPGSSSGDPSGSLFQIIIILLSSLALVWALRQVMAGHKISIRNAYYMGMYPLVPVLLLLFLVLLQLVPATVGLGMFSLVVANGIAANWFQELLWGVGCLALVGLSLYWLTSSVIALYIATVPEMTPMRALRTARQLVRYRRWKVMRKLLFLPMALLIVTGLIVIPVAFIWDPAAPWAVYVLSMLALAVIHGYIYTLYRELLI